MNENSLFSLIFSKIAVESGQRKKKKR